MTVAAAAGYKKSFGGPSFLHRQAKKMLLLICRGSISGTVGSFQSERAFSGQRALPIECSLVDVVKVGTYK